MTAAAEFGRSVLITDESLFASRSGGRWGYAIVSYFGGETDDYIDQPPPATGLPAASFEIPSDFATALRKQSVDLVDRPATVERNEDLNAVGGVRLPNVELGVGTYRAIGPPLDFSGDITTQFFQWLAGEYEDLGCQPRDDGTPRFQNHGEYVSRYRAISKALLDDGFIEQRDAARITSTAASSGIGRCN